MSTDNPTVSEARGKSSWRSLMQRIHQDQSGAVSLETILIIGAIALPILIFIIKFGWPKIRDMFFVNTSNLDVSIENMNAGQ